jgi:hypothetical protein
MREGVDASRRWFAPPRAVHDATGQVRSRQVRDLRGRTRAELAEEVRELLARMHEHLQTGYAPDAVLVATEIAEIALAVIVRDSDTGAAPDPSDELREVGELSGHRDVKWLRQRRAEAQRHAGQVRAELDDDGRRAATLATRLAVLAGLVTEGASNASQRDAQLPASAPVSPGLLRLDRSKHRQDLEDRLEQPHRVLVLLTHGEIDQGHDHFAEIVTWRLRSGQGGQCDPITVEWPDRLDSLGMRLAELYDGLASALKVRLEPLAADPATPEGAPVWAPALAAIRAAINERSERLFVRHVLRPPRIGVAGDDLVIAAYVRDIWAPVAKHDGQRAVVELNLRRKERRGFPMGKQWRASRGELRATRAIARTVDQLAIPRRGICVTLPELTSIARPDLVDWLHAERACERDLARLEARHHVQETRGGRFDLIVERLTRNLDRTRNTK